MSIADKLHVGLDGVLLMGKEVSLLNLPCPLGTPKHEKA
jgi:hypothetical protein